MKIRIDFVSNSSSASYVILWPKNFDYTIMDLSGFSSGSSEIESEMISALNVLADSCVLFASDVGDSDLFESLIECLEDYAIAKIESGAEDPQIVLIDEDAKEKIERIVG